FLLFFFFFFQAEDGIRDLIVTGVQTCALPILIRAAEARGQQLVVGHSHSFEPPIRKIREIAQSGALGRVRMLHNWCFTDWLYRRSEERRVGKECRSRVSRDRLKKNKTKIQSER